MKAVLEFDLSDIDEQNRFNEHCDGPKTHAALQELDTWLRNMIKHPPDADLDEDETDRAKTVLATFKIVRGRLRHICEQEGVEI